MCPSNANHVDIRPFEVAGVVWLVTHLLEDAKAGLFGPPITFPVEALGVVQPFDRAKVERFKSNPEVLAKPALVISNGPGIELLDGNHRLTALREMGRSHFTAWAVPPDSMPEYVLPSSLVASAVALLLANASAR